MKALLTVFFLFLFGTAFSQLKHRSLPYKVDPDFIVVKNEIWLLNGDSTIRVFDAATGKRITKHIDRAMKICGITRSINDDITLTDRCNNIYCFDIRTDRLQRIASCKSKMLTYAFLNSRRECFVVTNDGIVNPLTDSRWFPRETNNFRSQYANDNDWSDCAIMAFIDRNDNIWINADHGEFGSRFFIFNTLQRKFISPGIRAFFLPFLSFCEVQNETFISGGFEFSSGIVRWSQTEEDKGIAFNENIVYNSDNNPKSEFPNLFGLGGPIAYRKKDSCIYMSTFEGLFKGKINSDLSYISKWQRIPNYILDQNDRVSSTYSVTWDKKTKNEIRTPHDKGSPILEGKIDFAANDKLVILGYGNGLFLFDGKKLLKISDL